MVPEPAASALRLEEAIHSTSAEVLKAAVADPALGEERALALLKRNDLPSEVLEQLSKNGAVSKSRKAKLTLVEHPKTPRHVSLPLVRLLYTFDLMQVALMPVTPADIKKAAEEALLARLEKVSLGERQALARRASGGVAGALLFDKEAGIIHAALENPRLTESLVIRGLMRQGSPVAFVEAVCHHPKWSLRREVRVALLRNEKTPMACALELARSLPVVLVREILRESHLPTRVKAHLLNELDKPGGGPGRVPEGSES